VVLYTILAYLRVHFFGGRSVDKNIIIQGLSGSLGGQLVIQTGKGGQTIIRTSPRPSSKPPSEAQLEARERFKEASDYATQAQDNPVYAERAAGTTKTARNVAVADWFHAPEVVEVDLSGWTGDAGETIRARARDDVQVETVHFVIAAEDGTLIEEGAGTPEADSLWWSYQTTVDHPGGRGQVVVTARDLPGHTSDLEAEKDVT
jgi:hypothetical protein